jgi:23S rRNA (uracil1939-C5)-methyltransferase
LNGKVTFIEGALPSETVQAQVIKLGKTFDVAKMNQIIVASPHRLNAPCRHYESCGGCSFQHLAMEQQVEAKRHWLDRQLHKVIEKLPINILSAQEFAYRRRARIAVIHSEGKTTMGFRGKGSSRIINIENCLVLTSNLQSVYSELQSKLSDNPLAAKLGHIELLEDTLGLSVIFRLIAPLSSALQHEWTQWADDLGASVYWQYADEKKVNILDADLRRYTIDNLSLQYHPQDFIQVNAEMNIKMVAEAMDWLAPGKQDVVLDLFCGVGNFSLPLAKRAKKVIGVEVQQSMVAAGKRNAQLNGLDNLSFIAADLSLPIAEKFSGLGVTKILLDPPRAGAKAFLDTIIAIKPQQILYISCDAATLARDAEYLVLKGFQVLRVTIMNMFPQTSHVESMILFQLK